MFHAVECLVIGMKYEEITSYQSDVRLMVFGLLRPLGAYFVGESQPLLRELEIGLRQPL